MSGRDEPADPAARCPPRPPREPRRPAVRCDRPKRPWGGSQQQPELPPPLPAQVDFLRLTNPQISKGVRSHGRALFTLIAQGRARTLC